MYRIHSYARGRLLSRLPPQLRSYVSSSKQTKSFQQAFTRPNTNNQVLWAPASNTNGGIQHDIDGSGSWSSPHDSVARNAFTKDHARLWTLLEAAIAQGEFKRGEDLIKGLAGLSSSRDITLAINNYLIKLVEENPDKPHIARTWLANIRDEVKSFVPNTITEATLLKNLCLAKDIGAINEFIHEFRTGRGNLKQLLSHVDVLGLKSLQLIVEECNIDPSFINENYRTLLTQKHSLGESSSSLPSQNLKEVDESNELEDPNKTVYAMDKSAHIPALQKGNIEAAIPTNTFGLKAIRHTLSGLKSADEIKNILASQLQNVEVDENNYVDFLSIYEQLSKDEIPAFDRALNQLNHKRQQEIEARGFEGAREKWRVDFERQKQQQKGNDMPLRKLDTLLWEWNEAMLPLVKDEFEKVRQVLQYSKPGRVPSHLRQNDGPVRNVSTSDRFEYGPYLLLVNPENLPAITMIELLNLNSTGGVHEGMRSSRAVVEVGRTVEQEFRKSESRKRERSVLRGFKVNNNEVLSELKDQISSSDLNTKQASWPTAVRAKIGSLLIAMLMKVARVRVTGKDPVSGEIINGQAPAFYHSYQYQNGNKLGVLKVHRNLAKHLSGEVMASGVQPQLLPMLVKPRPWTAYNKGGYLYTNTKVMRSRDSPEQIAYLKTASDMKQLDEVYKGLNVLGETAWTVNRAIFDVLIKVWNTGEEFLDIPPNVDIGVELPPAPPRDCDPADRRDWMRTCRELVNRNQQLFSQRCDANYKLEIARAYLGERFYFPHNLDFRGRAYPLPPHMNHLGNDMSRGLLKFWEGRELGESGLRWLKIHIANVYGHSKYSFDDRCKFVEENFDSVIDSANNPLDGQKWWQEAESPWQCLAACIELRDAYKLSDPTTFVSRIPVHQDGTCNGLQHYAALGGDMEGASEVNLVPSSKPQDVYTRVLAIVEKMVAKEAEQGVEAAKMLSGRLSRKIVKQTVMTNVYGVTFVGARQQIANKLKGFEDLDRLAIFQMATYLAKKVLEAVRTLFYGAHLIQDWLGDNATLIARSVRLDVNTPEEAAAANKDGRRKKATKPNYMSSVIWTSPLGLPCVQPYREDKKKQVITAIQSVFIQDPYAMRTVNARKQRTAFPPNYIHSLDATHMLMSAIGCGENNVTFAAVHDSYWTHAGDVDRMNTILRDSFINLHSQDLIGQLRDEFQERYQGLLHLVEIKKDSPAAKQILQLREKYAHEKGVPPSKFTIMHQLNLEQERLNLLNSSEPEKREAGERMVTPVTIMEGYSEEELEDMVRDASEIVKNSKSKRRTRLQERTRKSSEHEGVGLDLYEQDLNGNSEEVNEVDELEQEHGHEHRQNSSVLASTALHASATENARNSVKDVLSVLVPLRIPKVPPKGEFNVEMLKDSKYFFS